MFYETNDSETHRKGSTVLWSRNILSFSSHRLDPPARTQPVRLQTAELLRGTSSPISALPPHLGPQITLRSWMTAIAGRQVPRGWTQRCCRQVCQVLWGRTSYSSTSVERRSWWSTSSTMNRQPPSLTTTGAKQTGLLLISLIILTPPSGSHLQFIVNMSQQPLDAVVTGFMFPQDELLIILTFSSSHAIIWSELLFVQYSDLWTNNYKTHDILHFVITLTPKIRC